MPEQQASNHIDFTPMKHVLFAILAFVVIACQPKEVKDVHLLMKTSKGDMTIRLYDETPLHRDNFIKLAKEGYYDSLLFHRVIQDFMIQGGDPDSRGAVAGSELGNGGPGYQIDAEFNFPLLHHKKGALAAARQGDNVNPEKKSSGSQFYIVQGKVYDDEMITQVEARITGLNRQTLYPKIIEQYRDTITSMQKAGNMDGIMALQVEIDSLVEAQTQVYTMPEMLKPVYKTVGGTPHLDNNYTVFGEVVEGLAVIDSIASVGTNGADRPLENVYIISVELLKK